MTDPVDGAGDDRRARVAAAGAVAAALTAVFHPVLLGRSIYHRDLALWLAPARAMVRAAMARGALPGWSPWEGIGFPIAADTLYATFYPLALLTLPLPLGWGETVYLLLHVLLGGAGLAALARRAEASPHARAAGALTWMLTGLTCSEWSTGARLPAVAWIPWACAFAWDLTRGAVTGDRLLRPALALGLVGAMLLLSGEVYVAVMAAIPALALAAAAAARAPRPEEALDRPAAQRVGDGGRRRAGARALGAELGPRARARGWHRRAGAMSAAAVDRWSLPPILLADLLVPRGLIAQWIATHDPALTARIGEHVFYFGLYAGATALALACLAPRRRGAAVAWTAAALVVLGVLFALGPATPALAVLRAVVRPFAHMRTPQKFLLVAHTPFALLVALGAERALRGARLHAMALYPAVLALATLAVHRVSPAATPAFAASAAGALVRVGLVVAALALARRTPRYAAALTLVVALDLGLGAWRVFAWDASPHRAPPALAAMAHAAAPAGAGGPTRLWWSSRIRYAPGADGDAEARALLAPKTHVGTGIAVVPGYDAAIAEEVDRLAYSGRLGAVRLLAADLALAASPTLPGLTHVAALRPDVHLHRVNAPLPRAFVAHAAVEDPEGGRLWHLLEEPLLAGAQIALRRNDLARLAARTPRPPSACAFARWAAGDVTLRCDARAAGVAVLAEQYSPGWQATVDGGAARVLRVNRVMLGVPVDAGAHTVRLRFVVPWQRASLALAGLGVVIALGLYLRARRAT
ncbi:MAG: YfhO family protein [Polyangiales bacterium]